MLIHVFILFLLLQFYKIPNGTSVKALKNAMLFPRCLLRPFMFSSLHKLNKLHLAEGYLYVIIGHWCLTCVCALINLSNQTTFKLS